MSTKHRLPERIRGMRKSSRVGLVAVLLMAVLAGSVLLFYFASLWHSYGYVLVVVVPLVIGFALAYFSPGPVWLRVLIIGVVLAGLFTILLTLGIAGLLCASILLLVAGFPLAAGLVLAICIQRFLEKRHRPGAPTVLSLLFLVPLGLLYAESLLPADFEPEIVRTEQVLDLPALEVWGRFLFYEDWGHERPSLLKVGLPRPLHTVGRVSGRGDIKTCVYDRGYLVKEITSYVPARELAFEVIQQVGIEDRSIRLLDGSFRLDRLGPGRTRVTLMTRYTPKLQARLFWRPWERRVTRFLHEHILKGVKTRSGGRQSPAWGLEP